MSYETVGAYDIRWTGGTVTTVSSLGVLMRTLANNLDALPDWEALTESEHQLIEAVINEREAKRDTVPPVSLGETPPVAGKASITIEQFAGGYRRMLTTNGVHFVELLMTPSEAREVALQLGSEVPS